MKTTLEIQKVEAFSFFFFSKTMHKAMRRATPKLQRATGKQLWIHNRRQAYLISRIRAEKLDACPGVRLDLEGLSSLCLYHNIYLRYVFPGLLLEETKRAWARI